MDREVMRLRDSLVPEYAALVYRGFWFAPERDALQALVDEAQRDVTGEARIKLYKGDAYVVGRRSESTLYDPEYRDVRGGRGLRSVAMRPASSG